MVQPLIHGDRPITIAEFERMPEEDAYSVELVRGRLVRSPRPASVHGALAARLVHRLYGFVDSGGLGVVLSDVGVILSRDPDTVRGPDVSFFSRDRIPESGYETTFWGPPDLAVEITSPSNRASEVLEKVADYLGAGVRLVWVFDPPSRTVSVYGSGGATRLLRGDEDLEGDDVLPGFLLPLRAFFSL